eukprot:gnl/TRDRNA2_/TRDRNA2_34408_c0_seq1.p1 gnl/TRDRNA2_/TRDRNA2_34408_c0~~gnl/TRDRNA2_/TRDRNA2_34408_c0_seq1.p1  ORF type:complete len:401 (-),score=59.65 gnl/TRDRNA2_/TRDRNA2_34408_c0_seq1:95-1297(-)
MLGESDLLDDLLRWCDLHGVGRSAVAVDRIATAGRGLVAVRPVAAGERLLAVPASAVLTDASEARGGVRLIADWTHGLALRLLREDALGLRSHYAPYVMFLLDSAGAEPPDLTAWESLPGFAGSFAQGRKTLRDRDVASLCKAVPGMMPRRAARALHAAETRSLCSESRGGARVLAPVFDLLNHDAEPNANWSLNADCSVVVTATCAIDAGEEVTISYGDMPNLRLLVVYGFVLSSGEGTHRALDLTVAVPWPDDEGPRRPVEAELRVLASGAVRHRSTLAPLLNVARVRATSHSGKGPRAGEAELATVLLSAARAEQESWQAVSGRQDEDSRLTVLGAQSAEVLARFMSRISAWQEGTRSSPLLSCLRPTPSELADGADGEETDETEDDTDDDEDDELR